MMGPDELLRAYGDSKRAYGDLRSVFEKLKEARLRMYEPRLYDMFMSKVLIEHDGRIHKEALNLMEELTTTGLAKKVPVYSSKGEYISDEYRAPPEMAYVLEEYSANAEFGKTRGMFLMAELIIRALTEKLTKRRLLIALDKLGVSEEEIKAVLKITYEQGITSRYNEAGDPGSPAFIILNKPIAREETERTMSLIEGNILR